MSSSSEPGTDSIVQGGDSVIIQSTDFVINKLLQGRSVPSREEYLSIVGTNTEIAEKLYDDVVALRETLKCFARGDFSVQIARRGATWGHLKSLQANLQHLTWQVEQVAAGDLSQRVDFMGDFSVAFNKMVLQLEDSLEEMKNREAAQRTQIMLDATPLSCCLWNEQHEIVDCNLEAVKLHEVSSKQEYLDCFFELMPKYQPDGRLSSDEIHETLRETFEKGYARCEFVHQTKNGEPIPAEITLVRVQQQDIYIVAGYIRDLRELKKQQFAIEQQRLLLLDVFNSSPICFAILVDDRIVFSSKFIEQFLGLKIGDFFIDCFVDQSKGTELLSNVKKHIHVNWKPITVQTKGNEVKEMLANLFMTNYYDEQGIIVWLVDITEIKRIEADLRAAKETAEHLGRVKDEFIANMSHELRTPMNAVLGLMHMFQNTSLTDEQTKYLDMMETSAKHLLQIINEILDFSHFEAGKVFLASEDFDVRQIISNAEILFQKAAAAKKLSLSCEVDDDVPNQITGDPVKLRRIFVALMDNAITYTAQGSIQFHVQLDSLESEKAVLLFSVRDTGVGMSTENQERIFQSFSQGDTSGTRKHGGIGLGLAITKNLVEMMGGRIWCESELHQGTTFFFTATFKVPKGMEDSGISSKSLQGISILLAEDNKINEIVATKMLKERGFQVDVAPNGLRAVEMVKQKEYALVLMDIQMPEMDGMQATQAIRSDPKYVSLPIVALTPNAMENDLRQYLAVGMNDCVAKPIDPVLLERAIVKWAKRG